MKATILIVRTLIGWPFLRLGVIVTALAFVCFRIAPVAQAVTPAPDGGYPGGNTAEGQSALFSLTTGGYNTAVGLLSLKSNTEGNFNTAIGAGTLLLNTAAQNTATGAGALLSNTTGTNNTANGTFALFSNTFGFENTAIGDSALFNNTGSINTALGGAALLNNTAGGGNTAIGFNSLSNNTSGADNTALGYGAGSNADTGDNNVYIGAGMAGVGGESNTTYIRNVYDSQATARIVYVNQDNKIGTLSSSRRYKDEIKPMDSTSEALFALNPVTFRYKKQIDRSRALCFGLVAEDVAKINPDLITRDRDGRPETVRYEAVNAMLLNEFLKEHRTVHELKQRIAALTETVNEQAAEIQKVSAKLKSSTPGPKLVLNSQ